MQAKKTTSIAIATVLTAGAATAAFAAGQDSERPAATVQAQAPLPEAEKLVAQTQLLNDAGGVLAPITDLIDAVLEADNGKLPTTEATKHAKAVEEALKPFQNVNENSTTGGRNLPVPSADAQLTAKAAAELQLRIDALLKATASSDVQKVSTEVQATVKATVNLLASVVLGGSLPAPDMEGLPQLTEQQEAQQEEAQQLPKADQEAQQTQQNQEQAGMPKGAGITINQ